MSQINFKLPNIGSFNPNDLKAQFDSWVTKQHPAVEVLVTTLGAASQGLFIGYLLGQFSNIDPTTFDAPGSSPQATATLQALKAGGPWQQGRNLAVMTGANAGLTLAISKCRNGKQDVWGAMGAAFGAGVAFSLVSGVPNPLQSALTTGLAFAAFNGLFYQLGKTFSPPNEESDYAQGKYLLETLGLEKHIKQLRRGRLTDSTIMLWNDRALQEVRIPPGPRLLILHHIDRYRNPNSILKPALPLPSPPAAAAAGKN